MERTFKRLFIELEELDEISDAAFELWVEDEGNKELEALADDAYEAAWNKHKECADYMVAITGGRIDFKTAFSMLINQREQLRSLVARIA